MSNELYIAMGEKPLGPFLREDVENMLENRSLHFVDFIWDMNSNEWKRIFEYGAFNHLLPKKPTEAPAQGRARSSKVVHLEEFKKVVEEKRVELAPKAKEKIKKELAQKAPVNIRTFIADALVSDDHKVYHAVLYAVSENEIYLASKSDYLPIDRDLKIIITSTNLKKLLRVKGRVKGVSKENPFAYSIVLDEMPRELR